VHYGDTKDKVCSQVGVSACMQGICEAWPLVQPGLICSQLWSWAFCSQGNMVTCLWSFLSATSSHEAAIIAIRRSADDSGLASRCLVGSTWRSPRNLVRLPALDDWQHLRLDGCLCSDHRRLQLAFSITVSWLWSWRHWAAAVTREKRKELWRNPSPTTSSSSWATKCRCQSSSWLASGGLHVPGLRGEVGPTMTTPSLTMWNSTARQL